MLPEYTLVLWVLGAIGTIFWTVVALALWVWRRRTPRVTGGLALASAALVVVSLVTQAPVWSAAEQAKVDEMRQEITPALERYRQAHGAYPPTLEAAGVKPPQTRYGPLRYHVGRVQPTPPYYSLSFGDAQTNGFVAHWDSKTGEWTRDEFDF
jgi:hypothetical protein